MAPYYGPNEDETTIQLERFFVAGDVASGVSYGLQLMLYYSCARYLWSRRRQSRVSLFLLAYITVLISVSTIFLIVQARTVQLMYVDYRNYPGGPWQFFLATQNWAVNTIFDASVFIMTFLSDALVLWRCWVIWTSSGKLTAYLVTAFPAFILLASFIMGTLWTLQSSQPGLSFYSRLPLAFGTSYYSISLGVNIILTILISGRLLLYRRQIMGIDHLSKEYAKEYVSLLTIIVESAAIYSLWALLFLVTYAVSNPANQILLAFSTAAQQIGSYLIIYRLADGRAWRKDTMNAVSVHTRNEKFDKPMPYTERKKNNAVVIGDLSTFHAAPAVLSENNGVREIEIDLENYSQSESELSRTQLGSSARGTFAANTHEDAKNGDSPRVKPRSGEVMSAV